MTVRQSILKLLYPLFTFYKRKRGTVATLRNTDDILPPSSFFNLNVTLTNGSSFSFEKLRGKKVLLVNTASDCGYTFQYHELQELYESLNGRLEIIAFPSNDFKEQEKGTDAEILQFCTTNYNVGFPLAQKSHVRDRHQQHPVFYWLTHASQNGWNDQAPTWNFSKYLVNEEGKLMYYFDPAISPASDTIVNAINE